MDYKKMGLEPIFSSHDPPLFQRIYPHSYYYVQETEQQSCKMHQVGGAIGPELAEEIYKEIDDYKNRSPHWNNSKDIDDCIGEQY